MLSVLSSALADTEIYFGQPQSRLYDPLPVYTCAHCMWMVMICVFRCVHMDREYFRYRVKTPALVLFVSKTLFPMFPVQFSSPSTATCRPSRTPALHVMLCWGGHLKFICAKLIRMSKFILFWLFFWEKWRGGYWASVKSSSAPHESNTGADFELWEHKQSWELNLITELNFSYCAGSFISHFSFFFLLNLWRS